MEGSGGGRQTTRLSGLRKAASDYTLSGRGAAPSALITDCKHARETLLLCIPDAHEALMRVARRIIVTNDLSMPALNTENTRCLTAALPDLRPCLMAPAPHNR